MSTDPKDKLCLALDVPTLALAEKAVDELVDHVGVFKIGMQLFTAEGPRAIHTVKGLGGRVFLDLKYHDIPNTVAQAGRAAVRLGVDIFTIHASGGKNMMEAVAAAVTEEAANTGNPRPTILAITVLTSLSQDEMKQISITKSVPDQVVALAKLAESSGIDGVVASPREISRIRKSCGKDFTILTPGIRPHWASDKGDQKRTTSPSEAVQAGANYIVVGRPVLGASDRVAACKKILQEIK